MTKTSEVFKDRIVWVVLIAVFLTGVFIGNTVLNNSDTDNSKSENNKVNSTKNNKKHVKSEPIVIEGIGQKATSKTELKQGLVVFELKHSGESNFSVWLLDDDGNRVELLVNEVGNFEGSRAVQIATNGKYLFDISAGGPWSITIKQ